MRNEEEKIVNALTVDVEDYFHVSNFASVIPQDTWDSYKLRVAENTGKILTILDEYNTKATFFILGWVAERIPGLIKEIFERGHEVASHGYAHQLIYNLSPAAFRSDVARSKHILEDITGSRINGYRAPSFTVTNRTLWALDILFDEGYRYDASMSPIRGHDKYGIKDANPYVHQIEVGEGKKIFEFPMCTAEILGRRMPIAGGGYFRLFPYTLTKWGIKSINAQGQPAVFYLHPWEIDTEQPRINADWFARFRHYTNISKTEEKLRRLLSDFTFSSIQSVLRSYTDYQFAQPFVNTTLREESSLDSSTLLIGKCGR